jgi:hypothetical protein
MTFRRSLELRIDREEALRLLQAAFGRLQIDGDTINCAGAHVDATVRLIPLADAEGAGAAVPRHLVHIVLDASCEAEAEVFMEHFDRAFLRRVS